jgi:osmoprotectant transport system permease protein
LGPEPVSGGVPSDTPYGSPQRADPPGSSEAESWGRICGECLSTRRQILLDAVVQHLEITAVSVLIGLVIALPLAVPARRWGWAAGPVLPATTILYTIPSLAMFSLLLPVYGLSAGLVVADLAAMNQQVDNWRRLAKDVARTYLEDKGLLT